MCTLHKPRITYDVFNFSKRPRDKPLDDKASANDQNKQKHSINIGGVKKVIVPKVLEHGDTDMKK